MKKNECISNCRTRHCEGLPEAIQWINVLVCFGLRPRNDDAMPKRQFEMQPEKLYVKYLYSGI